MLRHQWAAADADDQFSQKDIDALTKLSIQSYVWSDKLSLEERVMQDLPWPFVQASIKLAQDEFNLSAYDQISSKVEEALDKDFDKWIDSPKLRKTVGEVAKKKEWFKSTTKGDLWFKTIAAAFEDNNFLKTDLSTKLDQLWTWVEHA